jgi:hypothetical protein
LNENEDRTDPKNSFDIHFNLIYVHDNLVKKSVKPEKIIFFYS